MSLPVKHESPDSGRSFDHDKPVLKRRRITKACDFCHRRGRKCKLPSTTSPDSATTVTCLTCIEHGATCTWDRVAAKRGVKSKGPEVVRKASSVADETWMYDVARHGERGLIGALLRVFFDTVYPIFPFFAESVLVDEWERTSLSSSRPAFARLMAICALSSCHVRDGAVFSLRIAPTVPAKHQQSYLEDARRAIPSDISAADSFQYLQTLGTLSLAAIQLGDAPLLHETLGLYHTVMAQHNFQNESRWPSSIDPVEVHVRRQFFWSMYRLEVHSALIMGHSIRCPEMQAAVAYPAVSDALVDPIAAAAASRGGFPSGGWLIGWNYITDLYRVLEHVIVRFRSRKTTPADRGHIYAGYGFTHMPPPIDDILSEVLTQRDGLPTYLARAQPPSPNTESNLCGFQVANIACTIQLVRMTSFSCQDVTFRDACHTATQLIEEMSLTPVDYLRAIGSPMLQELAGVGQMLTSFIGRQLHPNEYRHLREVIRSMAIFLENLGPSLPLAVEAGQKLLQHIGRIDEYLERTQPQDTSILNEPELTHAAHEPRAEIPIQHFVVPHNFTIPMEYLDHIPWPSPFGALPTETEWTGNFSVYSAT
ncbi:hypothetical protein ACHAQF_008308 [Verticillium nonalfalfae]